MKGEFIDMKEVFINLLKDERGVSLSTESLMFIVGIASVASIVLYVIAGILVGKDRDGTGGMSKHVKDRLNEIMSDIGN